jgi:AraC-like DNA-binding protein
MTDGMPRDPRELGGAWARFQQHHHHVPAADLAPYVEFCWAVSWRYDTPYRQLLLPAPNVHLTFEGGRATVHGVRTRFRHRTLDGEGGVVGVAFRPGTFRGFLGAPVRTLLDRSVDGVDVFGAELPGAPDLQAVERFLRSRLPAHDEQSALAADIVTSIRATPGVTGVRALADDVGLTVRSLQRLFAEHVGIGPKWVIRRYRLQEVTERLAAGASIDWAALAAELEYADQPHLIRDFRAMTGESPTRYASRY